MGLGVALPTALLAVHKRVPKAYLQCLLYDKQGNYLSSQVVAIDREAKGKWQAVQLSQLVEQDGYIRIRLVNESRQAVYFDDVSLSTPPAAPAARLAAPLGSPTDTIVQKEIASEDELRFSSNRPLPVEDTGDSDTSGG